MTLRPIIMRIDVSEIHTLREIVAVCERSRASGARRFVSELFY